jgi:hypothetical protein
VSITARGRITSGSSSRTCPSTSRRRRGRLKITRSPSDLHPSDDLGHRRSQGQHPEGHAVSGERLLVRAQRVRGLGVDDELQHDAPRAPTRRQQVVDDLPLNHRLLLQASDPRTPTVRHPVVVLTETLPAELPRQVVRERRLAAGRWTGDQDRISRHDAIMAHELGAGEGAGLDLGRSERAGSASRPASLPVSPREPLTNVINRSY